MTLIIDGLRPDVSPLSNADDIAIQARVKWLTVDSRPKQLFPLGDWDTAIIRAGRFFGKTRTIVEEAWWLAWELPNIRVHALAPTLGDVRRVLFEGEALALDTPIATPHGWASFGDLEEGDAIFAGDGTVTRVVGVTAVWQNRPCFAVSVAGATPIIADAKHKWVTSDHHDRRKQRAQVRTTAQIVQSIALAPENQRRFKVPMHEPLDIGHSGPLFVPAYTLGAWLGDGTTRGDGGFCSADVEIIDRIRMDGFEVKPRVGSYAWGIKGLKAKLRYAGLLGRKEIPPEYLRATFLERLNLLRGLMDTDGYVSEVGQCAFDNTDQRMVEAVRELLLTLGFKPGRIQSKQDKRGHKTIYRVSFRRSPTNPIPFHLSRKAQRCTSSVTQTGRIIQKIEPVPSVPVRCIQVAHESGTFLAGRDMVVTHNSGFVNKMPKEIVRNHNKSDMEIHLVNGSMIAGFSTVEKADRLRGPQSHHLIFDEAAAADVPAGNLEDAYKVAALGCRLPLPAGHHSRKLIATTPRPIKFLRQLEARPGTILIHGTSHENLKNVNLAARRELLTLEGTQYGKQEIYGDYIDDSNVAIIKKKWFRLWPAERRLPEFCFVIESYDTAASDEDFNPKTQKRDPTACTVWGVFMLKQAFSEQEIKALKLRGRYGIILCDCWTSFDDFPALLERARKQHATKWGKPGRKADIVLIEDKSSGRQLRQMLATYGVPCWPYNPGRMSKTMRAHAASPVAALGVTFLPESGLETRKGMVRDWVEPFVDEVCTFAGIGSTEHDDILDTYTQTMLYLKDNRIIEVEPDTKDVDYEAKREREQREAALVMDEVKERVNPYAA